MNRFTAAGIAAAAQQGERIVIISDGAAESKDAFDAVRSSLSVDPARATRGNGSRIELAAGGRLHFRSRRQELRGLEADTVYLDTPASDEDLNTYEPVTAASPRGEIITA